MTSTTSQHIPGTKLDSNKPRVDLVLGDFAQALEYVSMVGTAGAEKYSPQGWLHVDNGIERYSNAMLRHWLAEHKGEINDQELSDLTGMDIPHAACVAWNALARLELMCRAPSNMD